MWEKILIKKGDVIAREIAGETILVPVRGNLTDLQRIWSLNPTAGYIWKNLDGRKSLADIHKGMLDAFDVEEKEAALDMQELITGLLDAGLVEEKS